MKRLAVSIAVAVAVTSATAGSVAERMGAEYPGFHQPGPTLIGWNPTTPKIGYGFGALVDRTSDGGANPYTVLTVGAQINATNGAGVHQVAVGIATEATALLGSRSSLIGIEATAINMEPSNDTCKISYFATFKNRWDYQFKDVPADAMNVNSQALRVESFPGTGFERAIVFAPDSLHDSARERAPVVIDYKEVPLAVLKTWALERYPDGFCRFYAGAGAFETRTCEP